MPETGCPDIAQLASGKPEARARGMPAKPVSPARTARSSNGAATMPKAAWPVIASTWSWRLLTGFAEGHVGAIANEAGNGAASSARLRNPEDYSTVESPRSVQRHIQILRPGTGSPAAPNLRLVSPEEAQPANAVVPARAAVAPPRSLFRKQRALIARVATSSPGGLVP